MTEHSHHHAHGHGGKEGCCSGGKKPDAAEHAMAKDPVCGMDVDPRRCSVLARVRKETGQKVPGGGGEIEVMGQESRGLGWIDCACAARREAPDQPIYRGIDADECAIASPGDQIDMRIALHKAGDGRCLCARPEGRQAAKPALRRAA